jgi:sn-glycerol 3-phosphate transport system substrate-binding protein
MLKRYAVLALVMLFCATLFGGGALAQEPITLQFYYPVGVAGPLAQAIDSYVAEFNSLHDDIQVVIPVFT